MGGEIITTEADRIFLAGEEQGLQLGLQQFIETSREFGIEDSEIFKKLISKFGLSEEEARQILQNTVL